MPKSRNQREGKYIPGWCYNPAYKFTKKRGKEVTQDKKRAGAFYELRKMRGYNDLIGDFIPGLTFVRIYRKGAFE
jgi:hypothetical protein